MIDLIKALFGSGTSNEVKQAIENNAMLIDVRNKDEYSSGSITGAINIPLNVLLQQLNRIPKDKPVVVFCRSGMRSTEATRLLQAKGYSQIVNGGGLAQMKAVIAK